MINVEDLIENITKMMVQKNIKMEKKLYEKYISEQSSTSYCLIQ